MFFYAVSSEDKKEMMLEEEPWGLSEAGKPLRSSTLWWAAHLPSHQPRAFCVVRRQTLRALFSLREGCC